MGKALVIGLGISGLAAAEYLLSRGWEVVGIDGNITRVLSQEKAKELQRKGAILQSDLEPLVLSSFSQAVLSPGIPPQHKVYLEALNNGIEIIGEAELAFRNLKQPCIGITGTNGKTTVTLLVEHILNSAGKKAKALGNMGDPLTAYLLNPNPDEIIVAEVSSYQLETMETPVFDSAVLLNITPDHLDRYLSMRDYAAAKCRIVQCMKPKSTLLVHEGIVHEFGDLLTKDSYSTYGHTSDALLWTDKEVVWKAENVEYFLPMRYRKLGMHESENAVAAWGLVEGFGVSKEQFCKSLETFKKPPHRIEFVKQIDGVDYFDDSKGTNIDAVIQAVGAMEGPVLLIAGGVDKGASYAPWKDPFLKKVKRIFAIGQAAEKIQRELENAFDVQIVASLQKAVEEANKSAKEGDSVLLSPGCSSFDMFRDYAHRGEEFKRIVDHLEERRKIR